MTTTPPAPTLTGLIDDDLGPRVEIIVSPMPDDAASVTVWRNWAGRRAVVRGASNAPVAGDYFVVDPEVPLGAPVTYTVTAFDSAGTASALGAPSDPVTLDSGDVWLSDALDPGSVIPVALDSASGRGAELRAASFRSVNLVLAGAATSPVFGSTDPVGFAGSRQSAASVPLEVRTFDADSYGALFELLNQAYPLCVRAGSRVPLMPGLAYLHIAQVTPTLDPDNVTCIWSMTGDSVQPPGAAVVVPTRIYDDLPDESASYDGLLTLYGSYLALQRGY